MRLLQVSKVTVNERITIGEEVLTVLKSKVGEKLLIYEDNGKVIISTSLPEANPTGSMSECVPG